MPNIDGGHYFLTALLPIDNAGIVECENFRSSPIHRVRDALEALPTALQSPASETIGVQSPFARSLRTHTARLVVIDAPFFNGRDPANSLVSAFRGTNLLASQTVDALGCPYLLFCADFDPAGDEPQSYLEELWTHSQAELTSAFEYCFGFDKVCDATNFAKFVIACQVETTMPFNDYWIKSPQLPKLSGWVLAIAPAIAAVLAMAIGLTAAPSVAKIVCSVVLAGLALLFDYHVIMRVGAKPFPAAPDSSLRHVLKALYLQQCFVRFAIAKQGSAPDALRAAFIDFVARHEPSNLDQPTQPPGVIRTAL